MKENSKAYIALLAGAVLISFSPVLIRMAGVPGIVSSFYRLAFGSLTLTPIFLLNLKRERKNISKKGVWIAIAAALSFSIDMAFWTEGIMATNATIPTLAGNLAPLWVGIMAMFIFKERNKAGFWFGLLFALLGVTLLVIQDLYYPNGMLKGLILGLLAGIFYAGFIILTQPGRKHLSALSFLYVSTLASTFFLGVILALQGHSFTGYPTKAWVIFAIMGLIIQAGAWFLINFARATCLLHWFRPRYWRNRYWLVFLLFCYWAKYSPFGK